MRRRLKANRGCQMITRATILLYVLLTSSLALAEETQLQAQFYCDEDDAKAVWGENDPTDYYAEGPTLWVKVWYYFDEDNFTKKYKYKLEFSGGTEGTDSVEHTTALGDEPFTQGYLWQKVSTGGDRWYKDFTLTITAEVRDPNNNSLLDWDSHSITFRIYETNWTADTQTDITCPRSSRWRFEDIAVTGNVTAQQEDGSGWGPVLNGRNVKIDLVNGMTSMTSTVQTQNENGDFSHTFAHPIAGWDPDYSYTVTATFLANQLGPHRPYASSSDTEQHSITRTLPYKKSMWQTTAAYNGTFTVQNPTDDTTWDSSAWVYDLDGSLRGLHQITAPPPHGVTVIDENTLDNDLTTPTGTVVIGSMIPGYETWAQPPGRDVAAAPGQAQPGPQAWIETLAFQTPFTAAQGALGWETAWGYDPPTESATLTMRFYNAGGSLLHTEYATVVPYQRVEVPPAWLAGAASMHADISAGLLVGWARARNGTSDAFETTAHTLTAIELCAPFMSAEGGWQTLMILHNPTGSPVGVSMLWYDMNGAPLASLPRTIPAKATISFNSSYVAPLVLSKAVEIRVTAGTGIVGSCVRTTDASTTMAESLVEGASALRVPSPGTPLLQEGLLVLHNPDATAVTAQVAKYRIDGTPWGSTPETIPAHATHMVSISSPQPGIEPIPSIEIRAASGGRVAAIMMFRQMETGGAASVEPLSMPDMARCEPPCLQAGWNLISIPLDPFNPAVEAVLAALVAAENNLTDAVYAYRQTGYLCYPTNLTELARGEGYWLKLANPVPFSVLGDAAREDVTIGLSKHWNLIGCPTTVPLAWASCSVTDGTETKTVAQAADAGWIQSILYYYEPAVGYRLVKTDGSGNDTQIRPCHAYWLRAYQSGLSAVVPLGGVAAAFGSDRAAASSQAEDVSKVKIHVTTAATRDWDFLAGVDSTALDSVDPLDLGAPPLPPPGDLAEVRFTSTIDLDGAQRDDWRPPLCQGTKTWPATASAINFNPGQCEQVTLTWDLSGVADYAYQLVDLEAEQTINLTPGGSYQFELCYDQVLPFELRATETGRSPCDYDCDGDVDSADLDLFAACGSGPAVPLSAGCETRDLDADGDVDQSDFAVFQRCYSGVVHNGASMALWTR